MKFCDIKFFDPHDLSLSTSTTLVRVTTQASEAIVRVLTEVYWFSNSETGEKRMLPAGSSRARIDYHDRDKPLSRRGRDKARMARRGVSRSVFYVLYVREANERTTGGIKLYPTCARLDAKRS